MSATHIMRTGHQYMPRLHIACMHGMVSMGILTASDHIAENSHRKVHFIRK